VSQMNSKERFFALLNGYVRGADAIPLIACWLLGGFVVQIVVALIDLKEGKHAGGNTFIFNLLTRYNFMLSLHIIKIF